MYEQEPTVNDILSSIRQILSNKIEDGNNDVAPVNAVNDIWCPLQSGPLI